MIEINWVSQERLSLKSCCRSYISPLVSRCLTTFDVIMYTITLHKIHVREMGRLIFSHFLNMGETMAEFHISDTAPDSSERSKRTLRIVASSTLKSCRTTGLILSGPAAFLGTSMTF